MILCIILLIVFLLLLIMMSFFTVYFIIPSIKEGKEKEDPLMPKMTSPSELPAQRRITPYETIDFIENLVKPIPMRDKIQLLNDTSENINNLFTFNKKNENDENPDKKGFQIWKYCYRIIKHFK